MNQDTQLVKIIVADQDDRFQVSARGLWEFLGLKKECREWFPSQGGAGNLKEGEDFIEFRGICDAKVGRPQKDYLLTRRSAYHIGMLNHGDKGKEIRNIFIDAKEEKNLLPTNKLDAIELSERSLAVHLRIYALLDVPKYIAQQEAVKETVKITGIDLSEALQLSPAKEYIKEEEKFLEPTELARHFGLKSAQQMNLVLQAAGLQTKTDSGWMPTEKAREAVYEHGWKKGTKTGYNLKWKVSIVKKLMS